MIDPEGRSARHSLEDLLALDATTPDSFRARHMQQNIYRGLFGGQLVAQALAAADRTVTADRAIHSLHCYFLRAGDVTIPIDYGVERLRDGARTSNRRVVAMQGGRELLALDCSYRVELKGFSHYRPATSSTASEGALDNSALREQLSDDKKRYLDLFSDAHPVELRVPGIEGFFTRSAEAKRHYWLRARMAEGITDPAVHRQILAYMSDFMFVGVALTPHAIPLPGPHIFVASMDHALWFHRPVRCDEWLLFETSSPNAEAGINLAFGFVYNQAGELVASIAQEALQVPLDGGATLG